MSQEIESTMLKLQNEYVYRRVNAPCGYASSAEKLDEAIQNMGIKTDFRFAYKYTLPDNITPPDYERKLHAWFFYRFISLNNFDELIQKYNTLKYIDHKILPQVKELALSKVPDIEKQIDQEYNQIISLNPILKYLKAQSYYKKMDILRGVCYKFNPQDIDYFMNNFKPDPKPGEGPLHDFFREIYQKTEFDIGYILSPKHRQKLHKILEAL